MSTDPRSPTPRRDAEVSVICSECGTLVDGVEAASQGRWVMCERCTSTPPSPAALEAPRECPDCGKMLLPVRYRGGSLNRDQWESVRAGDWYCETCPPNDRSTRNRYRYFWNRELPSPTPRRDAGEEKDKDCWCPDPCILHGDLYDGSYLIQRGGSSSPAPPPSDAGVETEMGTTMILRCDECGEERRPDGGTIVGEIHDVGHCPRRGAFRLVPAEAVCYECGLPYADFPDLVVPHDVWAKISPTGGEGGLLCPTCMCGRAEAAGLTNVPARFTSGPFCEDAERFDEGVWRKRALEADEQIASLTAALDEMRIANNELEGLYQDTAAVLDAAREQNKQVRQVMDFQIQYGREVAALLDQLAEAVGLDGRDWPALREGIRKLSEARARETALRSALEDAILAASEGPVDTKRVDRWIEALSRGDAEKC